MRCGDIVRHIPTGEKWVVAWAEGENMAWTGWPDGIAKVVDCILLKACSDEEHRRCVISWSVVEDDPRSARVMRIYGAK